jgi:hypothetical protein
MDDPIVTIRPKKFHAGPKRHSWKNLRQLKAEYRAEFWTWFCVGAAATYPLALVIGRRAQHYQGGVPAIPVARWVDEWPNVHANRTTNRFFRRYAGVSMVLGGFTFASYMADDSRLNNEWYTRPDLKPKAAMVKDDSMYDSEAYQQLLETNYLKHQKPDAKKSTLYRWLRPGLADFEVRGNRFQGREVGQNYNIKTGAFPTLHHDYADHTH